MNRKGRLVNKYLPIKYSISMCMYLSVYIMSKKTKPSTQNVEKGNICWATMNFNQLTLHKPTCSALEEERYR